ncbi:MAG: hypothetical protein ACRD2W_20295 [Acidimicrobiales bacterium]
MPWCETCAKYHQNGALTEAGACPDCGTVIGEPPKVPWHFKLLVASAAVYLGWRAVQGVAWLIHRL